MGKTPHFVQSLHLSRHPATSVSPAIRSMFKKITINRKLQNHRLHIFFFIVYFGSLTVPTLRRPFVNDDYSWLLRVDESIDKFGVISIFSSTQRGLFGEGLEWSKYNWHSDYYRPIIETLFAIERSIFGFWPAGYRLTNAIIIILSTYLVYLISIELFKSQRRAFVAATLYGTSYIIVGPFVGMISNRTDSVVGIFVLLSFYLFLRFRRSSSRRTYLLLLGSISLALFSKETAVGLPFVLLTFDILTLKPINWRQLRIHIPPLGLLGLYFIVRYFLFAGLGETVAPLSIPPLIRFYTIILDSVLPLGYISRRSAIVLPIVGFLIILNRSIIQTKARYWLFLLLAFYITSGSVLVAGGGPRFLFASSSFLWLWLSDLLVSSIDISSFSPTPLRLLSYGIVSITVSVASSILVELKESNVDLPGRSYFYYHDGLSLVALSPGS